MERVLHMKGGVGETSYVNNSLLQRKVIMQVKTILEEDLSLLMSNKTFNSCWKIVDLGCSSGPNALMAVSNILETIDKTSLKLNHGPPPIFQIYLNDLYENDYNTIFKLLPNFYQSIQQERGENAGACFVNATPGNFYGRLFPNNYIDFFHSSYSLHWLSQAPNDSTQKAKSLNKGNIYITRTSPPSVREAYFKQFERDFKYFLKSRFEELASGGMMVLTLIGRDTTYEVYFPQEVLGMVLDEMVQEGLVEEEKLDLFDFPTYHPTIEEIRKVIEAEGSFTLQKLKTFKIGWDANLQNDIVDYVPDSKTRAEFIAKYHRAIFEPLLIAVFGENIMDRLFSRFAKWIAQLIELEILELTNIVLFMTKDP